jgi:hypothetical protein
VLLNCVHPSAGPRGIIDTRDSIKELFELTVCPVHICQRSAYAEAPTSGQSPQEADAEGKAADEMKRLFDFTSEVVNRRKDVRILNSLTRREADLNRLFDSTRELVRLCRAANDIEILSDRFAGQPEGSLLEALDVMQLERGAACVLDGPRFCG